MNASTGINYYDCAVQSYKKGEFSDAINYFRLVIQASPNDWNAQFYLAMGLAQNLQTQSALAQFRTISELCPDTQLRQRAVTAAKALNSIQK